MRRQFKPEFAKDLCSSTSPADELLFGGYTAKRVKEINELNKLINVCRIPLRIGNVSSVIMPILQEALDVLFPFVEGDIKDFLSFFGMAMYASLLPYLWDFLVLREFSRSS